MRKIIALLMSLFVSTGASTQVYVDRIESNNIAVLEISKGDYYKLLDVPTEDFNISVSEGDKLSYSEIDGKFYMGFTIKNAEETYYQFRSNDDTEWWTLTEEQIGFMPEEGKEYTLIYYNNGTTAENFKCDVNMNHDCECFVYDDIYLGIVEK